MRYVLMECLIDAIYLLISINAIKNGMKIWGIIGIVLSAVNLVISILSIYTPIHICMAYIIRIVPFYMLVLIAMECIHKGERRKNVLCILIALAIVFGVFFAYMSLGRERETIYGYEGNVRVGEYIYGSYGGRVVRKLIDVYYIVIEEAEYGYYNLYVHCSDGYDYNSYGLWIDGEWLGKLESSGDGYLVTATPLTKKEMKYIRNILGVTASDKTISF